MTSFYNSDGFFDHSFTYKLSKLCQITKKLDNFDIDIVLWKLNHLLSTDVSTPEESLATEPLNLEPQNTESPNIEPLNTEPPNTEDPEYELDEEFPNTEPPITEPPTTEPSTEEPLTTNTLDTEPSIAEEGRKNIFFIKLVNLKNLHIVLPKKGQKCGVIKSNVTRTTDTQ